MLIRGFTSNQLDNSLISILFENTIHSKFLFFESNMLLQPNTVLFSRATSASRATYLVTMVCVCISTVVCKLDCLWPLTDSHPALLPPTNEITPDLAWYKYGLNFFSRKPPTHPKWNNTRFSFVQIQTKYFFSEPMEPTFHPPAHQKWDNTRFGLIQIQTGKFFLGLPTQN